MHKIGVAILALLLIVGNFAECKSKEHHRRNGGRILHVGNGMFSTIQEAINNASDGDTIYVHEGVYFENIFIGKKIKLIGEHPLTTIIDGSNGIDPIKIDVVEIASDNVTLSNFTIRNSISNGAGIDVWEHYRNEKITNCIFYNNYYGIHFSSSYNNYVSNCSFHDNKYGIVNDCCCGEKCSNSLFYRNNFANSINAIDEGINKWDNGYKGNYWSDYSGTDENDDGIGDIPYNISGGINKDMHPLIHPIDVIPPLIEITFPNGGETLAGNITIRWNVSDNNDESPTEEIYYSNDGNTWHLIDTVAGNEYTWDTSLLPVGNYLIKVIAIDDEGNRNSDVSGEFTIISPPFIKVIKPEEGYLYFYNRKIFRMPNNMTVCIGRILIKVWTFNDVGIKKVEFYVDDNLMSTDLVEPYEWIWKMSFGMHHLKIVVYDKYENVNSTGMYIWKFL